MKIVPETAQAVKDETRTELQQKKQQEYRFVGKQRKVAGHTLFEFDKQTKEIRPAEIKRTATIKTDGTPEYKTRADIKQGCFYIQALNAKNAAKKLRKLGML